MCGCLSPPLPRPPLGTQPETQACALTRNRTSDPLVLRLAPNPLSRASQGCMPVLKGKLYYMLKVGYETKELENTVPVLYQGPT